MAVVAADIEILFSTKSGSAGLSLTSDGDHSLGKYAATNGPDFSNIANNLFADVPTGDNSGLVVDYRCVFIHNKNTVSTYQGAVMWFSSIAPGGAIVAMGVDATAASAEGSATAQAASIATRLAVPGLVSFTAPSTQAAGIALGDIGPNQVRGIWFRRTPTDSPFTGDGYTLDVNGTSA